MDCKNQELRTPQVKLGKWAVGWQGEVEVRIIVTVIVNSSSLIDESVIFAISLSLSLSVSFSVYLSLSLY